MDTDEETVTFSETSEGLNVELLAMTTSKAREVAEWVLESTVEPEPERTPEQIEAHERFLKGCEERKEADRKKREREPIATTMRRLIALAEATGGEIRHSTDQLWVRADGVVFCYSQPGTGCHAWRCTLDGVQGNGALPDDALKDAQERIAEQLEKRQGALSRAVRIDCTIEPTDG